MPLMMVIYPLVLLGGGRGKGGGTVNLRTSKVQVEPGDDIIQTIILKWCIEIDGRLPAQYSK